jgi:mannose-6-phosphate isomerase-like protein (cupin superfamily)
MPSRLRSFACGLKRRLSAWGEPPALGCKVAPAAAACLVHDLAMPSFDLLSTYVCLSPDGSATTLEVTPEFWQTIAERADLGEGRLVAVFASDRDWPHWEMHPAGEELLLLLSGRMMFVFEDGAGERTVELTPGRACLVPRGVWHRALVPVASRLLAITHGRGTQHRAR